MCKQLFMCAQHLHLASCSDCKTLEERVDHLENDVDTLQHDADTLEHDVDTLENDVSGLQTALSGKQDKLITMSVTLAVADWNNDSQTVTALGVLATDALIISPDPDSLIDYADAGVYCSAQGTDSLTFTSLDTPASDLTVNVLIAR